MEPYRSHLAEALPRVLDQVAKAAWRSGREADAVRLVAVTKGHPSAVLEAAIAAGLTDLGENRVEALEERVPAFGREKVTWHMIGHVQSRKAPRLVGLVDWVHAVDSVRLGSRLARRAEEECVRQSVLLQVNVSGEETKSGFAPADLVDAAGELAGLAGLRLEGLMTMAPFVEDERVLRSAFQGLRTLRDEALDAGVLAGGELSMGMSNDFELAVEEGSTMIRLGTVLFGRRPE
jgi:pyridoxal phosphate enzyme (YggS family)